MRATVISARVSLGELKVDSRCVMFVSVLNALCGSRNSNPRSSRPCSCVLFGTDFYFNISVIYVSVCVVLLRLRRGSAFCFDQR